MFNIAINYQVKVEGIKVNHFNQKNQSPPEPERAGSDIQRKFKNKHQIILQKLILTFSLSMLYQFGWSQNLVPNPSFEDENICKKYHENCSPAAWRSTTLKQFLYPEYLADQRSKMAIRPSDGTRFIGLRVFNTHRKFDRSIVQVPLLCQLEKGKKYKIKFDYLSSVFWINSFHLMFVDSLKIYSDNIPLMKKTPQITINFQNPHERKKWLPHEIIYEAKGNEVGFILGNLKSDEATQVHLFNKKKDKDKKRAYYYFDNFSIKPIEEENASCDIEKNKQFIYEDSIRHDRNSSILDITMQQEEEKQVEKDSIFENLTVEKEEESTPMENTKFKQERVFTIENILFATNSDQLLPIAYGSLEDLVSFLQKNKELKVLITGHTDDVGNEADNLILSKKRALSVAQFLVSKGISQKRVYTTGKGETQPITNNLTSENRRINRRVEFQLRQIDQKN